MIPGGQYEYLPHTADVQLHSWGSTLPSALQHLATAMFGYQTDLNIVGTKSEIGPMEVTGHDLHTLVFSFLDEWLVNFHITGMVPREIEVEGVERPGRGEEGEWRVTTRGRGEKFDLKVHKQGTEVKAITYSAMQVKEVEGEDIKNVEIWVIIDI